MLLRSMRLNRLPSRTLVRWRRCGNPSRHFFTLPATGMKSANRLACCTTSLARASGRRRGSAVDYSAGQPCAPAGKGSSHTESVSCCSATGRERAGHRCPAYADGPESCVRTSTRSNFTKPSFRTRLGSDLGRTDRPGCAAVGNAFQRSDLNSEMRYYAPRLDRFFQTRNVTSSFVERTKSAALKEAGQFSCTRSAISKPISTIADCDGHVRQDVGLRWADASHRKGRGELKLQARGAVADYQ